MKRILFACLILAAFSGLASAQNFIVTPTVDAVIVTPGQHAIVVSWTESTPAVTSFNVYRGPSPGGENYGTPLASVSGAVLAYPDFTSTPGTNYCYTVTSVLVVESAPSNEVCGTTPVPPNPPFLNPLIIK